MFGGHLSLKAILSQFGDSESYSSDSSIHLPKSLFQTGSPKCQEGTWEAIMMLAFGAALGQRTANVDVEGVFLKRRNS